MRDALGTWHMGRVIYAYRTHPFHRRALSQDTVGNWIGLTQAQLSRIENGRAPEELTKLIRYAQILGIPGQLLWFALPDQADAAPPLRSPAPALTISAIIDGRPVTLPIDRAAARETEIEDLLTDLTRQAGAPDDEAGSGSIGPATPIALTAPLNADELDHLAAGLREAGRYLDESVIGYFRRQLSHYQKADGRLGPDKALPVVLGMLGAIQQQMPVVKPQVQGALLAVGAEAAEFAGWLYRDLRSSSTATYWYDRAMEWAQIANDTAMQGYILLRKSQMAYEERDAQRVATLAEAANHGQWHLPPIVRVEVIQQDARGRAMLGEPAAAVERRLDQARQLFDGAQPDDRPQFGTYLDAGALLLREASCYIEAGKPIQAVACFDDALSATGLSRRDQGYFRARRAFACALSGDPDDAARDGLAALSIASSVKSERTTRELRRTIKVLAPWSSRPAPRQLREALRS